MKQLLLALFIILLASPIANSEYGPVPLTIDIYQATVDPVPLQVTHPPIAAVSRGDELTRIAYRYLGGNPTGWRHAWCGRFMGMVARKAGAAVPHNPNLARNWQYAGAQGNGANGNVVVLSRGRGGHVGIKLGSCGRGSIKIISGNHGGRVGVGCYAAHRVIAYRAV